MQFLDISYLRKIFFTGFCLLFTFFATYANPDRRIIQTAMPFLILQSDARANGMGNIGVATTTDIFSQSWNPSKYIFSTNDSGIGIAHTTYLTGVVNDMFITNISYFRKSSERSVWGASVNYFNIGEIELTQEIANSYISQGSISPNEFTLDFSYSLLLSENFSMGVLGKWLHSNLEEVNYEKHSVNSVAAGISGFYQSKTHQHTNYKVLWKAGFNLSNIGPKISYEKGGKEFFIPTNLKLGLGSKFIFPSSNSLELSLEANKLLVPTPPIYDYTGASNQHKKILKGKNPNVFFLKGMLQSFTDAPNGFSEELQEITWAIGAEYNYENTLFLRGGYFYENKNKGGRNYVTTGIGIKMNKLAINLSYALSIASSATPLQNSLQFSLSYDFNPSKF